MTRIPSISPKRAAERRANGETYFRSSVSPGGTGIQKSGKPVKKVNPERQAKRRKVYAKAIGSAYWKRLKAQVYAEQEGLCICGQEPMTILDHKTYRRLGHELREDVQGLGDVCNVRETTTKRANWFQPRRG